MANKESDLYPPVCQWLTKFLTERYHHATIYVFDSSRKSLSRLIQEKGLISHLPTEWPSWDIYVDIVGFVITNTTTKIAFVECKNSLITLANVSQLLGYSRVALPEYSFIIAPQGISSSLRSLLVTFNRVDILQYHKQSGHLPRSIVVAKWNEQAACPEMDIITGDDRKIGRL